jgi:hypothetical protein
MSVSVKIFPSVAEARNASLVRKWKEARFRLAGAKAELEEVERELAERAREMRLDFDAPFAPGGRASRSVVVDGGEAGRVLVLCEAVFQVAKDLGERAKKNLEGWSLRFRAKMARKVGEDTVEDIELMTRVLEAVGGRGALSASAVQRLKALELKARHSKTLCSAVQEAVESLQPLENRVRVREQGSGVIRRSACS